MFIRFVSVLVSSLTAVLIASATLAVPAHAFRVSPAYQAKDYCKNVAGVQDHRSIIMGEYRVHHGKQCLVRYVTVKGQVFYMWPNSR